MKKRIFPEICSLSGFTRSEVYMFLINDSD